ncbi:family 20 glycosylhydrolase [Bifidobacterium castoris]|uniref:Repeat protein n=1 Tax=Bifidobacterium castoris TaxID=2306972 RepID=A0A430F750_9BIFI|nr:family 20 glycosylhydrolase [Bifidobacterium castoris]RSX48704.1 repeat protein [Bifidobacterium castoris]
MKQLRFKARGLCALIAAATMAFAGLATAPAMAEDGAAGWNAAASTVERPQTVPSLDGWTQGDGTWTLGEGAHVVAADALAHRAQALAQELSAFTDVDVAAAGGAATDKDIELVADAAQQSKLGAEGFTLRIGKDGFKVIGASDIGVFYGTRAVSQMLRQGVLTIPAGEVTSKPKYAERGATLCACQINMSTDWINRFLEDMADLRLNTVLMEMKLKPEEANTSKAATWSYYTRDDVKAFVQKARSYGIDVIPEINSPGHMNIWLENYPEYQLADRNGNKSADRLDITNPDAVRFYETLIDEYDGVFDTDYWHMGADEYMIASSYANYPKLQQYAVDTYGAGATPNDAFTGFINHINDYVKAKGKHLRIWNDGIVTTKNVTLDKDIIVEYWYSAAGARSPQDLLDSGSDVVNASQRLYWSRSATGYSVNSAALYNDANWNVGSFDGGRQVDPNNPHLLGAKVSIWPDTSDWMTENEVEQQISDSLRFIAQMTWSASRPWADWNGMKSTIDAIGKPLANRQYVYQPLRAGTYDIPKLSSVAAGPWTLTATSDGYYQMRDDASGQCLVMDSGIGDGLIQKHLNVVTQVGARPGLAACQDMGVSWASERNARHGTRNVQKWQIRADGKGRFSLAPALTQQRLAVATGKESHIDLDQMRALGGDVAPKAGVVAQFPADLVSDNALFDIVGRFDVQATASSREVRPSAPVDVTVEVTAAGDAASGDVTVTPELPEGWKVMPDHVDLKSIPAGKTARAIFRVANTKDGIAELSFTAKSKTGATGVAKVTLDGSTAQPLPAPVDASEYAADSVQDDAAEHAPIGNAFDGDLATFWHTKWNPANDPVPHWIAFKTGEDGRRIASIDMTARQDKMQGIAKDYEIYVVSADTAVSVGAMTDAQWGAPVAKGAFERSESRQTVALPDSIPEGKVYVKLKVLSNYPDSLGLDAYTSIAELHANVTEAAQDLTAPDQPTDNPVEQVTPQPGTVDKDALRAEVDSAGGLEAVGYTAKTWTPFAAALSDARGVLDDAKADQKTVDAVLAKLVAARQALVEVEAAKPTTDDKSGKDDAAAAAQPAPGDAGDKPAETRSSDTPDQSAVVGNTGSSVSVIGLVAVICAILATVIVLVVRHIRDMDE